MADSYVCSTAKIRCTLGDKISTLTVFPTRTIFLTGQPQANIADHQSMANIAPFGKCHTTAYPPTGSATAAHHGHLTPMPCVPNTPYPWMNGKNDTLLQGQPALLKSSTCRCVYGGIISITFDGQTPGNQTPPPTLPLDSIEDLCSKEGHSTEEILDGIQLALDAAGFIPAFGAVPDLLNAAIYAFRGKWLEAGMSIVAAVPGIGDAVAGVKIAKKGYDAAKISKMAKRSVGKNVDVSIKGLVSRGYSKEEAVMFRRAVRNERRNVARKFYEDAGFKRTDIDSHLHGIDFKKPVVIETVPPPSTLYQYQTLDLKTGKWRSGNYYTPDPKAKPSDLGIYDKFSFTECGLEFEKRHTKITEVKAQQALKTSAYSVHDNWSVKGKEVLTKGGGIQYFMPLH